MSSLISVRSNLPLGGVFLSCHEWFSLFCLSHFVLCVLCLIFFSYKMWAASATAATSATQSTKVPAHKQTILL